MQQRGPYTSGDSLGANNYQVKMGSKTKTHHVNMLKKYIARQPDAEVNVVPTNDEYGATVAVDSVSDPKLGEVPD